MNNERVFGIKITGLPMTDPVLSESGESVFSGFLVRVNEFLLIEHGEGYVFDILYDEEKNKYIAYDSDDERLGELPSAARQALTVGENYRGRIMYFEERGATTTAMIEVFK